MNRRSLLQGLAGIGAGAVAARFAHADQFLAEIHALKPGQFTWHPERSPKGHVAIIVSIPEQRVHVYRNGIRIAVSTCSTGRKGHETPTGVFTILQKDKNHHSSTCNNAPMPNMNRLMWSGVALHAGNLPGYPASHGCVRLPLKFSELLYSVTDVGTPVILAGSHADPQEVTHPGLVLTRSAVSEFDTVQKTVAAAHSKASRESLPWATKVEDFSAPTSILVSGADKSLTVLVDGEVIAEGRVSIAQPEQPLGSHVFILQGTHEGARGLSWHAIGHHSGGGRDVWVEGNVLQRIRADDKLVSIVHDRMRPGLLFVTTDLPAHRDTRSGKDFVLMTVATS